mmetsp:Transcript_153544/g.492096  ORF Transcript_153544/g.492096 Transcript_153544/m.492096 type:complete len:352 (+) Transcript_153544:632-1687(+)
MLPEVAREGRGRAAEYLPSTLEGHGHGGEGLRHDCILLVCNAAQEGGCIPAATAAAVPGECVFQEISTSSFPMIQKQRRITFELLGHLHEVIVQDVRGRRKLQGSSQDGCRIAGEPAQEIGADGIPALPPGVQPHSTSGCGSQLQEPGGATLWQPAYQETEHGRADGEREECDACCACGHNVQPRAHDVGDILRLRHHEQNQRKRDPCAARAHGQRDVSDGQSTEQDGQRSPCSQGKGRAGKALGGLEHKLRDHQCQKQHGGRIQQEAPTTCVAHGKTRGSDPPIPVAAVQKARPSRLANLRCGQSQRGQKVERPMHDAKSRSRLRKGRWWRWLRQGGGRYPRLLHVARTR